LEDEVLVLQFALSFIGTLQKAKDRHVDKTAGWCIEVTSDRKVWVLLADGPYMVRKVVTQSTFGLSDVE